MAIAPTQTDYELAQLKTKSVRIKVDVLNFEFQTVNSLEGRVVDGSITIDANSDIRRTCSLTLTVDKSSQMITPGGEIWLDKFMKVYVGIDNPRDNNNTVWYNMGIYLINNPNSVYNVNTNQVSFEGLDLMAKLTGRRNGQLPAMTTVVPTESNLADVVKKTITELGGFNEYIIVDQGYTVPYTIKKDCGSTVYDLLVELRDLYPNWEMFFDVDGVFHWQPIPQGENEPVIVNFDELSQALVISSSIDIDFENVKNNIIVYGRLLDNGHQIKATATDTIEDSPFNVNKIGGITYIVQDDNIYNDYLAELRAGYELFLHARMNDSINLEIVPIYWLNDVNVKMRFTNENQGITGDYLIKSLSIPLGISSTMTITATKIYPEYSALTEQQMNLAAFIRRAQGTKINYHPADDPNGVYRLFYYDAEGKYGTKNTIYLKRDVSANDTSISYNSTENTPSEDTLIQMRKMNPAWRDTDGMINTDIERRIAYFYNNSNWTKYVDSSKADFALGAPSLEMFLDSYNNVSHNTGTNNIECKFNAVNNAYEINGTDVAFDNDGYHKMYTSQGTNLSQTIASPYGSTLGTINNQGKISEIGTNSNVSASIIIALKQGVGISSEDES